MNEALFLDLPVIRRYSLAVAWIGISVMVNILCVQHRSQRNRKLWLAAESQRRKGTSVVIMEISIGRKFSGARFHPMIWSDRFVQVYFVEKSSVSHKSYSYALGFNSFSINNFCAQLWFAGSKIGNILYFV